MTGGREEQRRVWIAWRSPLWISGTRSFWGLSFLCLSAHSFAERAAFPRRCWAVLGHGAGCCLNVPTWRFWDRGEKAGAARGFRGKPRPLMGGASLSQDLRRGAQRTLGGVGPAPRSRPVPPRHSDVSTSVGQLRLDPRLLSPEAAGWKGCRRLRSPRGVQRHRIW